MSRLLLAVVVVLVLLVIGVGAWRHHWLQEQRRLKALPSGRRLDAMTQLLRRVVAAAERSATRPFLLYGTLLGWRRARRLICWDYDVDFGVDDAQYPALVAALREGAAENPAKTSAYAVKTVDIPLVVKRTVLIHRATGISCDIFPMARDRRGRVGHPRLMPLWARHVWHERTPAYPADSFYPLQRADFLGSQVWVPNKPDALLEGYYGASFMTPDQSCPGCANCGTQKT